MSGRGTWKQLALTAACCCQMVMSQAHGQAPNPRLGPWHCIGPFKDALIGLHLRSFDCVFPPEKQAVEAGGRLVDLGRSWKAENFIGEPSPLRKWQKHPEWVDGYHHYLPVGPPPMKNETCYLYRTIAAAMPWGYQHPYPLNEHEFLASYGGDGGRKNRLYLLDDRGNRKCIYEAKGNLGCWSPLPLEPRSAPPVVTARSTTPEFVYRDPEQANRNPHDELTGTFLVQDVYEGLRPHVKRGEIKALQIVEQVPRSREVRADAVWGHWAVISRGTMYVRRLIGTVPVEPDGSAHFAAPAIRDISFNALDAEGRVVRHMGSTLHVMPAEKRGCVGCHEPRCAAPNVGGVATAAARRAPSVPKYPEWTQKGILDFTRVVQPVLDRHCVKCHGGPTPKGAVDLSGDKTHYFSMAYDTLLDRGQVHYIPVAGAGHEEGTAKARGSYVSRIRDKIETDHSGKVLPPADRRRIYAWIDANVPYYGTYVMTNPTTMGGRDRWYVKDKRGWFRRDLLPVFNRRCLNCHKRRIRPQTYNFNPGGDGTIVVTSRLWDDTALSQFQHGHGRITMIGQVGPSHRINLTHPEWSRMLTAPLAKDAGGMQLCKAEDGGPVFGDRNDPDYKAMLSALRKGHRALLDDPRVDMPPPRRGKCISRNATYEASSVIGKWSRDMDKLLTGEPYQNGWAVWTEKEEDPWLIVTLPQESNIEEVEIVNRQDGCREFARTLTMWLSSDRKNWKQVWRAGGIRKRWRVHLPAKPPARYIKLGLRETQYLNLKYVFVYGPASGRK